MPTARIPARGTRIVLSLLLLFHFVAIFLNNLSWTPAVAVAWPVYSPYVRALGLVQDWGMYKDPYRFDQRLVVEGLLPGGLREIPPGSIGAESSRMLYFMEGLFTRNKKREAVSFLRWVHERIPEAHRPAGGLALRRDIKQTPAPGKTWMKTSWRQGKEFVYRASTARGTTP